MSKLPSISVPIQIAIAGVTLAIIMALMVLLRDPLPPELVPTREEAATQETAPQPAKEQDTMVASGTTAESEATEPAMPLGAEMDGATEEPADFGFVGEETVKVEEAVETAGLAAEDSNTASAITREPAATDSVPALSEAEAIAESGGAEAPVIDLPATEPAPVTQETAENLDTSDGEDTPVTAVGSEAVGPVDETDTSALEDTTETRLQGDVAEPEETLSTDVTENVSDPGVVPEVLPDAAQPDPTVIAPRFDLVRVDNSGATVIAGQAAPGAEVQVTLGNAPLETVRADQSGSFVAIVQLPAGDNPQTMGLEEMRDGDVVSTSPQTVLVVPPQPDTPETSPTIVVADTQGAAVIQPGQPVVPEELSDDPLSLDTISYDQGGAVVLAGRGSGEQFVRVYVDNQPVQTEPVLQDGNWRVVLPAVDEGVHTLRVDQISKAGDVLSRVESPFKREAPAELAAAARHAPEKSTVVVQPGHTLWALAETRYGDGVKYVQIFRANRDRIRDADLIYPGQVFDLPEGGAPN
ncbi:LysM peptidoglycan-binding domain-containing protein [Neptunicoccus cionae]|uniref:LysM peptidoglycan-binding domain-containing protein n=1 Tax=Neptunicoccus cionae TaxID=2035344 RepID=UPI000C77ABBC|nr:LysM peptidoglycan-binding domain-containing protein [Amylibacter cionae]PLS22048.1 hypothetical protein C0U40_06310 [Amylibacter cionae]